MGMGNIHVKLFYIWTSGSGGDAITDGRPMTNDGQKPITIAHLESSAQVS